MYDLNNAQFIEFFKKTTGYRLMDCACGFEKVKNTLANPSIPIESLNFTYISPEKNGLPLPEKETQSMRNSWALTRQKLQDQWDIYTGVKSFQDVYRARN